MVLFGWRELARAANEFFGPNNATDLWHVKKVNPQSMAYLTEKAGGTGSTGPAVLVPHRRKRPQSVRRQRLHADRRPANRSPGVPDGTRPALMRSDRAEVGALHRQQVQESYRTTTFRSHGGRRFLQRPHATIGDRVTGIDSRAWLIVSRPHPLLTPTERSFHACSRLSSECVPTDSGHNNPARTLTQLGKVTHPRPWHRRMRYVANKPGGPQPDDPARSYFPKVSG